MSRLVWDAPDTRIFETGLDRGVLYTRARPAYPEYDIPEIPAKAVSWTGLTGVDEKGADGAKVSLMDGRPFLILPQPKEYQATLRAWTYPDEFAAVMGLAEATPGLYLDSQMGDYFDLSYRTLVGDAVDSTSLGYKIHLVYNAAPAPSDVTYETLSSDINPHEFSWDIQAVPVKVDGYRPTAHIVIDSRHISSEKLNEIEALLYGTVSEDPAMPTPQAVFDIITYGDGIVIIDHGDGTWSAKGSYKNIYMIGDGIFRIDNVNAVDHGDGTYTISSTP